MQEQGTKMYVDAVLKTHERVVQVKFSLFYPFKKFILYKKSHMNSEPYDNYIIIETVCI